MARASVTASPPTPLGFALARLVMSLTHQAAEQKRAAKAARRRAAEALQTREALIQHAASAGITLTITGEAEEQHGPEHEDSSTRAA